MLIKMQLPYDVSTNTLNSLYRYPECCSQDTGSHNINRTNGEGEGEDKVEGEGEVFIWFQYFSNCFFIAQSPNHEL